MQLTLKKAIFWAFYSMATTLVLLCIVETILRFFNPLGTDYIYEARRYFKIMKADRTYAYIHRAGVQDQFQGVDVRINTEGFRGRDFAVKKPERTYRILLLGDSVVFSWGVEEKDSLAVQVEKRLRTQDILKQMELEVLPIGVGSWNTRTQYEFMAERGIHYNPDLVVWVIVANDLEPKTRGRTLVPLEELRARPSGLENPYWDKRTELQRRWLTEHSHLWAIFERYRRIGFMRRLNNKYVQRDSPQAIDTKDAVKKLAELLNARNIPIYAFLHGEIQSDFGLKYHALYKAFLDQAAIPSFVFSEDIYKRAHMNSVIDPHQNSKGIEIMAENIVAILKERNAFEAY